VLSRFVDDDFGYLQWLRDRPGTFVLDTERRPSRSFVVVHRTTCPTISGQTKVGGWTTRQIKVCATTYEEIEDWAQYHVGVQPTRCHQCKPASHAGTPAADPEVAAEPAAPAEPSGGAKPAAGGDGTPSSPKRRSSGRAAGASKTAAAAKAPAAAKPASAKPATAKPATAKRASSQAH
jgi:hypothetical protein